MISQRQKELFYTGLGKREIDKIPYQTIELNSLDKILEFKQYVFNLKKKNVLKFKYKIDSKKKETKIFGERFIS